MNKPFAVCSCIALLYKTAIPSGQWPSQERIQSSSPDLYFD